MAPDRVNSLDVLDLPEAFALVGVKKPILLKRLRDVLRVH